MCSSRDAPRAVRQPCLRSSHPRRQKFPILPHRWAPPNWPVAQTASRICLPLHGSVRREEHAKKKKKKKKSRMLTLLSLFPVTDTTLFQGRAAEQSKGDTNGFNVTDSKVVQL